MAPGSSALPEIQSGTTSTIPGTTESSSDETACGTRSAAIGQRIVRSRSTPARSSSEGRAPRSPLCFARRSPDRKRIARSHQNLSQPALTRPATSPTRWVHAGASTTVRTAAFPETMSGCGRPSSRTHRYLGRRSASSSASTATTSLYRSSAGRWGNRGCRRRNCCSRSGGTRSVGRRPADIGHTTGRTSSREFDKDRDCAMQRWPANKESNDPSIKAPRETHCPNANASSGGSVDSPAPEVRSWRPMGSTLPRAASRPRVTDDEAKREPSRYIGGPWDGEPVVIKPGWLPPDAIEHVDHPEGRYVKEAEGVYRWRAN